ncbi:MAG: ABC transporter permease [Firmicutes bacterium]|nr:ABC transporter permease [Bacillota bacterium]
MFISNMLASMKMMIRQRDVLMWLIFFPIILATVFYFAFGSLGQTDVFIKSEIAVANLNDGIFSSVLSEISDSEGVSRDSNLFNVSKVSEEEGRDLLAEEKIDALLIFINDYDIKLVVSGMNVNSTVVKTFLDNYLANAETFKTAEPVLLLSEISDILRTGVEIVNRQISKNNVQQNTTYFYALFGMVIFFFNIVGMEIIKLSQPKKSPEAARQNLSSTSRNKIFLWQFCGMFIWCIFIILLMIFYVGVVLGVPLGNVGLIFIACVVGTLASLGIGMALGTLPIKNQNLKDMLAVLATMLLSALTGLMGAGIKETITNNAPIINYLNPVALISDSFHSLYYYDSLGEFFLRVGILGAFAALFLGITALMTRRKKYAYI